MSIKTTPMSEALYQYMVDHGSRSSDPVLESLVAATKELGQAARMQIGPDQGAFMTLLTRLISARHAVEIGTFTGYSGLCLARGLAEDGKLLTCDINEETTRIAREHWARAGVQHKIDLVLGPALATLRALPKVPHFDIAFIDADKPSYRAYYEEILVRLRQGGLILIDNVLWGGSVIDPAATDDETRAIRELNDLVARDSRVEAVMLPIADGLTLLRKV